ncbi:TadE/TadG family type IV pilus assembly protein [Rhodopseudomonas boonkerdii]|uniref:TadE/TadG family type IV pilus assembly protein n=1 Tax=Rhodopseudomonas boonkerdii TaxID=475937 RepID=UPI001E5847BF|nr:TadE/TadG family type IV pilus assembly protein [Rhodopseudomonas boonkerdii]
MTRFAIKRLQVFASCRHGSSAVEFAMLLPLFLTIVFGIVVFGSYLAIIHGVQQLAAEAARSSVAGMTETERSSLASAYVANNATTYPLIDPAKLTTAAATSSSNANVFVVTVNYDASSMFIYTLPFVPKPTTLITRSASIPYGGF